MEFIGPRKHIKLTNLTTFPPTPLSLPQKKKKKKREPYKKK